MTAVHIIIGLIILTCALICYIFIKQTIVKKKREKARLFKALENRAKELLQMLNAFPPQFLPKDLSVFLHRCIVDAFEQLSKLEPDRPEFLEQFTLYTTAMETIIRQPAENNDSYLQSSSQINEIRQYLNYLGRFLQKWLQRGNLSERQYSSYKNSLKNLANKLMVDNYILSARKSIDIKKYKLAVHYFTLAKKIMAKEGLSGIQKESLHYINEELAKLTELIKAEEDAAGIANADITADNNESNEWSGFDENDDWKKKNVYD